MSRGSEHDPNTTGEVTSVLGDGSIRVLTENRNGKKTVHLVEKTWKTNWEPVQGGPKSTASSKESSPSPGLSEDDVRRIVREELANFARRVESATRSFLDELFDSL